MSRRFGTRSALVRASGATALLAALAACSDRSMSITGTGAPPAPSSAMPSGLGIVEGSVDAAGNVTLTPLQGTQGNGSLAPGIDGNIYGTQNVNVRVYAAAAVVTTVGSTKTWTMQFGVRNLLPYPIGSNQAGPVPSDTTGIFLAIVSGPTVTQTSGVCPSSCAMNITAFDGTGTFTAPNQPYVYWRERLAPKQVVAGLDTVSQRRTITFTSPTQVTNFRFFLMVGADWPAPAQTSWSVFYNAATDSAADTAAKPLWRKGTQQFVFGTGNEAWSKNAGVDSLKVMGGGDYYLFRRDSLAATSLAYMETQVKVSGGGHAQTSPESVFGLLDGLRMAAVGVKRDTVGFVFMQWSSFFGIPVAVTQFIANGFKVNAMQLHTYRLRKFGTDSVTLEVDGTRRQGMTYAQLPTAGQIPTFTTGPAEFFGAGSWSGDANSAWKYVTYGIGVSHP